MHDFNIKKCLDYKVNKYNNTCHGTTKMKLVGVKSNALIDSGKRTNDKNSKFKIGDNVRTSKYRNIFAKYHTSI